MVRKFLPGNRKLPDYEWWVSYFLRRNGKLCCAVVLNDFLFLIYKTHNPLRSVGCVFLFFKEARE